jgi:hypothetical protein
LGILNPKIENPGGNALRRQRLDLGHNTITYKLFLNKKSEDLIIASISNGEELFIVNSIINSRITI